MVTLERPDPEQGGRKKKNSLLPIALISIVLCGVLTGAWLFFSPYALFNKKQLKPAKPPANQTSSSIQEPASTPAQLPSSLPSLQSDTQPPSIKEQSAPATEVPVTDQHEGKQKQCGHLAAGLRTFFTHLDRQEYIQDFHLGVPAQEYFLGLATKVLNNPPVVSRESDDLYTILTNMAHFFRVIGGKNIMIIKTILDRERDTIEDVAAELFQWTTEAQCNKEDFSFHAPLDKMYEYAGFFLSSMGGRSYLFRRDSRSRLLVNYYAILLVDRANREHINRHGINLKPLLATTIKEVENTNQLIYKEKYLDTLYTLEEKYQ
ncbi:MAG TPA: hypothetical protein ENK96_02870 [Desulfobulbaceae bacterium]|nr:hypothetical protein [Desulfobulbaceae bacterium]